ncbi:MAG: hypothetical protein LBS96_06245 [Oscillospiraceae bacterium]|jgi:hypothetical protein|nr:hypothetical protein [Oscillospiraceae bacterium]
MIDKVLLQEERKLLGEIQAQRGMNWRKFGKLVRLNALVRTITQEQDSNNFQL